MRCGVALALGALGALLDAAQLVPPEALELARPVVERPERIGVGAVEHPAPVAAHVDQADVAEHAEVLRDGRLLDAQAGRDLPDRTLLEREKAQDLPAPRFGDRVEGVRGGGGARHGSDYRCRYGNMSRPGLRGREVPARVQAVRDRE